MNLYGKDRRAGIGERGFTLLEMVIVMVLIGLIASIGVPRFLGSLERAEVKTSAKKIAAAMRSAKTHAIAGKKAVTLVIDRKKMTVFAIRGTPSKEGAQDNDSGETQKIAPPIRLSDTVKVWTENETIAGEEIYHAEFSPRGTATGGVLYVTPRDSKSHDDEKGYVITLDPLSGKPKVYPATEAEDRL